MFAGFLSTKPITFLVIAGQVFLSWITNIGATCLFAHSPFPLLQNLAVFRFELPAPWRVDLLPLSGDSPQHRFIPFAIASRLHEVTPP